MEPEILDLNIYRFNKDKFDIDIKSPREIIYTCSDGGEPKKCNFTALDKDWSYYFYRTTSKEKILDKIELGLNPRSIPNRYLFFILENDILWFDGYGNYEYKLSSHRLYSLREIRKRDNEFNKYQKPYASFGDRCYDRLWKLLDRNDKLKQILS